jgi:hypothetical protein
MKSIVAILAVVAAAACGGGSMSLSVRTGAPTGTVASSALTLSNGVTLSRIRMVITKVELELARTADAGAADLEEHEMKAGPFVIDLSGTALDSGAPVSVASADLPAGTYKEIKFKIHKPEQTEQGVSADPGLTAMAAAGASIVVDGTIDGNAFTFSTPMDVEQQLEGSFDLASGGNLTLNVDATSWFGGSGSARLDPRDTSMRSQIEANIQRSFKAYRDNNHDGHED